MSPRMSRPLATVTSAVFACVTAASAQPTDDATVSRALDRMVGFLGGTEVVFGLRTLAVTAESRRAGDALVVPSRTTYAFPLHVRREFVVGDRSLALVAGPEGGQLVTRDGAARLSDRERLAFERSTMRDPVALAKARLGRGVSVTHAGSATIDGAAVDLVRLRQVDNETVLAVAVVDGRLVEIRYPLDMSTTMTVRFDDWTTHPPGLRYPGRVRGSLAGAPAFDIAVRNVEIDPPFDPRLFAVDDGPVPVRNVPHEGPR